MKYRHRVLTFLATLSVLSYLDRVCISVVPTYMVRARGFTEGQTMLAALPFLVGAAANLTGGYARDITVRRWGPILGPRYVGLTGLFVAAGAVLSALVSTDRYLVLASLALCYGGMTFQQPTLWATCVDIGKRHAGAVSGCLNTAAAIGGLASSLICGYLVQRYGDYDAVLLSMAAALIVGAGLWLGIDATETLDATSARPIRAT
jgi:MFS transporter, ACS family, glucarate transporter